LITGCFVVAKLTANIRNRVRKLPKPSNKVQAMQPMFEAISNAIMATEDLFSNTHTGESHIKQKEIQIRVSSISKPDDLEIEITDNGIGFDSVRFKAFCEVDTAYKAKRGGKGVGRLFWLDAFNHVDIHSAYKEEERIQIRNFSFVLDDNEQVPEHEATSSRFAPGQTGSSVKLTGLKQKDYKTHFPKKRDAFIRYFAAHFIADFLVGSGPSIHIDIDGEVTKFPKHIVELKVGDDLPERTLTLEDYGELTLRGFVCKKEASSGLEGNHVIHFLLMPHPILAVYRYCFCF